MEALKCRSFGSVSMSMSLLVDIWEHGRRSKMCGGTRAWRFLCWVPVRTRWVFRNTWLCMGRRGSPRVVRSHFLKSWPSCTLDQTLSFLQSHCAAHRVTLPESRHNASGVLALGIRNNNKGPRHWSLGRTVSVGGAKVCSTCRHMRMFEKNEENQSMHDEHRRHNGRHNKEGVPQGPRIKLCARSLIKRE